MGARIRGSDRQHPPVFDDKPVAGPHQYQNGWQAMAYIKNVFNVTAITGTFLNSDDSDLTTNVFLTDPRLFGIRITRNW